MPLPLTREGNYTVAPASGSWLARPEVAGCPDSHHLRAWHLDEHEDAFAAAFTMDRCQDSLRQQVLFASLPDGRVLSWERVRALRPCELMRLEQGFLRITNETFQKLDNGCRGERVLATDAGATTYRGWIGQGPDDDVVDDLGTPAWVNVDGRLGLRVRGSGRAEYRNRHHWEAYQVIADDLVLSLSGPRRLGAGDVAGTLAALLTPGQAAVDTERAPFDALLADETALLVADGWLVALRLAAGSGDAVWQTQVGTGVAGVDAGNVEGPVPAARVAVYDGVTADVDGGVVTRRVRLESGRPRLLRRAAQVAVAGACRLEATPTAVCVTAAGDGCRVRDEGGVPHELEGGQALRLQRPRVAA
jgi:hypothetical protein